MRSGATLSFFEDAHRDHLAIGEQAKSVTNMLNKLVLMVIVGFGIAAAVNSLDQNIKSSNSDAHAAQNNQNRPRVAAITAGYGGHFIASTLVNGIHVEMLMDTGASKVVLTSADAQRVGIDLDELVFDAPVMTANGRAYSARAILDEVNVGGIKIRNVSALVSKPEQLSHSLLGMSYLGKLRKFEIKGDQLVLHD